MNQALWELNHGSEVASRKQVSYVCHIICTVLDKFQCKKSKLNHIGWHKVLLCVATKVEVASTFMAPFKIIKLFYLTKNYDYIFSSAANKDFSLYHVSKEVHLITKSVLRRNYVNGIHYSLILSFLHSIPAKSGFLFLVIYEIQCLVSFLIISH